MDVADADFLRRGEQGANLLVLIRVLRGDVQDDQPDDEEDAEAGKDEEIVDDDCPQRVGDDD